MLNFKSNITYYLSSTPTDMRKGREGLAGVVRETMQRDPYTYGDAFIFYSKDLKKVKILHYDINGFVIYAKWFDDGRFLSPYTWKKAGEKGRLILSSDTKYNQINFSKNHVSCNARKIGVTFIWWFTDEIKGRCR